MPVQQSFSSVPVLDFSLVDSGEKDRFVDELRHILLNVGFLYLSNAPVDNDLIDQVASYAPKLFDLPQASKDRIAMRNSERFLGYNKLGAEITKGSIDLREQFDFARDFTNDYAPGKPEYTRMWGNAQWPEEDELPGFKATYTEYLRQLSVLSFRFMSLVAEALGLPPNSFDPYYEPSTDRIQHRSKVVKYPSVRSESSRQGVGPHFDGQFLTLLLQVTENMPGLEAQNLSGDWIPVLPKKGTLVVNFGKGLETVTRGLALATSHRVVSPAIGSPARYSIPFFQFISQNIRLSDMILDIPEEIIRLKDVRGHAGKVESVNFSEYDRELSGLVSLIGRIKSHPDVAERFYPELWKKFFPNGTPTHGSAY